MINPPREQKIFWIEVDRIKPNPMQPRSNFDEVRLLDLAESIRQYGVLQPLVVVRKEIDVETGTRVEYELIAGERRLRAAKMAGLMQVPVIIRDDEGDKIKLELTIIENLQREDLNPLERAIAFRSLAYDFKLKHHEIGGRIGKSRVFVTNTLRLLNLPEEIQKGLRGGMISEGHMRPLLMLSDRKKEQTTLYYEILEKKLTVRQSEEISRRIAQDRARKKDNLPDLETRLLEEKISERLGTKVILERQGEKRKLQIEFFSDEELQAFLDKIMREREKGPESGLEFPQETQQPESDNDLIEKFSI